MRHGCFLEYYVISRRVLKPSSSKCIVREVFLLSLVLLSLSQVPLRLAVVNLGAYNTAYSIHTAYPLLYSVQEVSS